jgi:hypothetical protein
LPADGKKEGLQGGAGEALRELGSDFACISEFSWPSPFPGREETVREDENTRTFRDEWGATLRLFKDHQTTPEHLGWECDSPEAWHGRFRETILGADSPSNARRAWICAISSPDTATA